MIDRTPLMNIREYAMGMLRRVVLGSLLSLIVLSACWAAPVRVLTDDELIQWIKDTKDRQDWIYVSVHTNALLQRNSAIVRENPQFASQLGDLLAFAIDQLQKNKAMADQLRAQAAARPAAGGVAFSESGLTAAPPRVDFPKPMSTKTLKMIERVK